MQAEAIAALDTNRPEVILPASRDKMTGKGVFPQVPRHSPVAARYQDIELTGPARLYSYTVIHPHPKTKLAPYALAYADFQEGVRVFARLECPIELIRIDMNVEPRAAGDKFVFVPAMEK
jgi:uncharacterized OB-fold protein